MKQMTFASAAWSVKGNTTRRERFLAEMNVVIPWARLTALIEPHYPRAGNGRQPMAGRSACCACWMSTRASAWRSRWRARSRART